MHKQLCTSQKLQLSPPNIIIFAYSIGLCRKDCLRSLFLRFDAIFFDGAPAGIYLLGEVFARCVFKIPGGKIPAAFVVIVIQIFDRPVFPLALSLRNDKCIRIKLLVRIQPDTDIIPPFRQIPGRCLRRSGLSFIGFFCRLFRMMFFRLLFGRLLRSRRM